MLGTARQKSNDGPGAYMPEELRVIIEVAFNVSYLVVVWGLVIVMSARQGQVMEENRALALRILWAFALLALGDTGHVGFRVIAYARGGLEANPALVGAGALSTAYTVTLFYMLMVDAWRLRFQKALGGFGWFLLAAGAVRLVLMALPQNQWWQVVAPYDWSLLRNSFLVIQGLGIMVLILRDAARTGDRAFTRIGWMIALSYTFYIPVILWVHLVPMLGMLMIPKTLAYVGVGLIAYRALYSRVSLGAASPAAR
jgi:hypothetical protein